MPTSTEHPLTLAAGLARLRRGELAAVATTGISWPPTDKLLAISNLTVVPSTDGPQSVVEEHPYSADTPDFSRQTTYFDFHTDGLYRVILPDYVILHCFDPGRGDSPTVVADCTDALARLDPSSLAILRLLDVVYLAKDGREHGRPLITTHPTLGMETVALAARGYCRGRRSLSIRSFPTLRQQTSALSALFAALQESIVLSHSWRSGDTVAIDNLRCVHLRGAIAADSQRRLARLWLARQGQGERA